MARYAVYAQTTISKYVGEFEADSEDAAIEKAVDAGEYDIALCHYCSSGRGQDIGEVDLVVEQVEG